MKHGILGAGAIGGLVGTVMVPKYNSGGRSGLIGFLSLGALAKLHPRAPPRNSWEIYKASIDHLCISGE